MLVTHLRKTLLNACVFFLFRGEKDKITMFLNEHFKKSEFTLRLWREIVYRKIITFIREDLY